jgi:hypothetical protein
MPFSVTIVELDETVYAPSEPVRATVRLVNVSPEPILLPWEPDWRQVPVGPDDRVVSLMLGLCLADERGNGLARFSRSVLYGVAGAPQTMRTLPPQGSLTIVLSSGWDSVPEAIAWPLWALFPRELGVFAEVSFARQPIGRHFLRTTSNVSPALFQSKDPFRP